MNTKIVCTIGPQSADPLVLREYYKAGMNVARLNGSHADLQWHENTINLIKETLPELPILLDIPGRKIRTTLLNHEPSFEVNDIIILTTDLSHDGLHKVPVNNQNLHLNLKKDDIIFADDGTLEFQVVEIKNKDIFCRAKIRGTLRSRKGINVPHVKFDSNLLTERDINMIAFACRLGVDYLGISFVESAEHILRIKEKINEFDCAIKPKIVAKTENQRGMDNLDEILSVSDVIMIDRGDLAVETSVENVVLHQKKILKKANEHGVPVIVATQMLHTMLENPMPTKAEISDITNAILDKASAIMLSGETAVGLYAIEAISYAKRISQQVYNASLSDTLELKSNVKYHMKMLEAAKNICDALPITKVVAITKTGFAARMMSAHRPKQEIICASNDISVVRAAGLWYGTRGVYVDTLFQQDNTQHINDTLEYLISNAHLTENDFILLLFVNYPSHSQLTNAIQLHYVKDLKNILLKNKNLDYITQEKVSI